MNIKSVLNWVFRCGSSSYVTNLFLLICLNFFVALIHIVECPCLSICMQQPSYPAVGFVDTDREECFFQRDLNRALALPQQARNRGYHQPLSLAKGFHMWGESLDVSPIHHHLGKMRMCQGKAAEIQGEKQYPNRYLETLTKWATESKTGVRIHGRKEDGKLTQRKTTVLDGCCCHLLLWANNQHLCFPSQSWVLDPWVFSSDVCEHCLCLIVCRNWSVCGNCA